MPLTVSTIFDSDQTGSTESIALQPFSPATSTDATMVSAFYGQDASGAPRPVQIGTNGKNITFQMLAGINVLTITVASKDPQDQYVNLVQASTVLATVMIQNHSGFSSIFLRGM